MGATCSLEVVTYKAWFQEYLDIFTYSYAKIIALDLAIIEHHIKIWLNASAIWKKEATISTIQGHGYHWKKWQDSQIWVHLSHFLHLTSP